ncbi:NAD(+) kinase [Flavobacterium psychrophilum]|nr:NAD(+) kinase [Flavobacterium psychrophilum]GAW88947.1 NAD(+) kinase [Flavobacterium psychrophilum]
MKIAVFGQFYQNSTSPIIARLFAFLNQNNIQVVIEEKFAAILIENKSIANTYQKFSSHKDLDKSFEMLISVGGDGTFLRATTLVRNSGIPILGINAGRLGFLATVQQENIETFLQLVLEKNIPSLNVLY